MDWGEKNVTKFQTKINDFGLNENLTSEMYLSEYGKFFGILERKIICSKSYSRNSIYYSQV